ncbi:MAG: methyltransferase domain-containing protein [Planctomycetes bacterium]|nr:methyltransferase domain-containing protein [Planctomycetota bacterium]
MNRPGEIEVEFGVPIPGRILPREAWVQTAVKRLPEPPPLDLQRLFGRHAPVVVDIGCGNGRFVVANAVRHPEHDHIGIDILPVVIRYATRRGNQRGLSNTRFAVCGGFEFVTRWLSPQSTREFHIYHPQPFKDAAQRERRLLTPEFLVAVHRALEPQGRLFLQTDNPRYWRYFQMVVPALFDFAAHPQPWPEDPRGRTRREIIARSKRLRVYRATATARYFADAAQLEELARTLPRPDFDAAD